MITKKCIEEMNLQVGDRIELFEKDLDRTKTSLGYFKGIGDYGLSEPVSPEDHQSGWIGYCQVAEYINSDFGARISLTKVVKIQKLEVSVK